MELPPFFCLPIHRHLHIHCNVDSFTVDSITQLLLSTSCVWMYIAIRLKRNCLGYFFFFRLCHHNSAAESMALRKQHPNECDFWIFLNRGRSWFYQRLGWFLLAPVIFPVTEQIPKTEKTGTSFGNARWHIQNGADSDSIGVRSEMGFSTRAVLLQWRLLQGRTRAWKLGFRVWVRWRLL